MPMGKG